MLKSLGLCCMPELAMGTTSIKLPQHVTTIERNRNCFLESKTTKLRINLQASPIKSKPTSLFYIFLLPLRDLDPTKLQVLEHEIPKLFLATEETFRDHNTMVLSESCLSSSIQKRLLTHILELEVTKATSLRKGFKIEVEIKVKVDHVVNIGCGCKGKETCLWRRFWDKHVVTRVTRMDCPICLTKLSTALSRMNLSFSHVFHTNCLMKWLRENTSCRICRSKQLGETASIY